MHPQQSLSPVEKADLVLSLINDMNISVSGVIRRVLNLDKLVANPDVTSECNKIIEEITQVHSGITSMHSIYMQARQRAVAAEQLSLRNQEDLHEITELRQESSATRKPQTQPDVLMSRLADSLHQSLKRLDEIGIGGKNEVIAEVADVSAAKTESSIDRLISGDGYLFSILSNEVHPLGHGFLKPSDDLGVYQESILTVPLENLAKWPEGFYDCPEGGPAKELYLKVNKVEFLWLFCAPEPTLYVRNAAQDWKGIEYFSKSQVDLFTNIITAHLSEMNGCGVVDQSTAG